MLSICVLSMCVCCPFVCVCCKGHSDCTFDPAVEGSQCFDNRTGTLCGKCPNGSVATLTPYTGSCVRESECWDIGHFVGICFVIFGEYQVYEHNWAGL